MQRNAIPKRSLVGLAVLAALMLAAPFSLAKHGNPRVLPPHGHAFGRSYGEWGGEWWRWVFAQTANPPESHPVIDPTGAACARGQRGPVWFLAGTFGGEAERTCTVPAGRAILFPLANSETDNFSIVDGQQTHYSREKLLDDCDNIYDQEPRLTAEIDGWAVKNPLDYAVRPTQFSYRVGGDDSLYDLLGGGYADFEGKVPRPGAFSCGYYLLLLPLARGGHTLHFSAELANGFALDVTYHLTVGDDDD